MAADFHIQQHSQPHKKLHYVLILIFIFFLLIITLIFTNQRSFPLLLCPSLYRDLFSTTAPSSQTTALESIAPEPDTAPQVRVFEGVLADSEVGSGKRGENGSRIEAVSEEFGGDLGGSGSENVPSSEGVEFDLGKRGNGAKLGIGKREDNGKEVDAVSEKSNANSRDNASENVPSSEGVVNDLGKEENGGEIVSVQKNENSGLGGNNSGDVVVRNEVTREKKTCNLYMGKWVKDDGYPLYLPGSCPFVDEAFDCQTNGRPDSGYLKWRWKPDDCDLPRFNVTDFLNRLRGKRLMLVGDSVNRNQFESMLCLLHQGLADKSKMFEVHGYKITKGRGFYIFKFADYNCTVEFVRSHFLVREGVRLNGKGSSNPTLAIDKIDKSAGRWKRADILIFNTGHWWTHGKTSRGKNYFKEGDYVYPRFDSVEAYRRALKTWANWIDKNVNPERQLVFYRAYSSAHFRGGDWDSGGTCNGEREPILSHAFLDSYPPKMKIVEQVIQEMKVPVMLLNITRLTNSRKDGHPSIYGRVRNNQTKISTRKQDCSHWCLPGVPDAWNELVYATLVLQQTALSQV